MPTAAAAAAAGGGAAAAEATAAAAGAAPKAPELFPGMEDEAALLEAFAGVPTVSRMTVRRGGSNARAGTVGGSAVLTLYLAQRNLPGNGQYKYAVHATVGPLGANAACSTPLELPADLLYAAPSPRGGRQLNVKSGGGGDVSLSLQVWESGRLAAELAVPKGLHGSLVNDGYFALGVAWADTEDMVAYVADTPAKEKMPAWGGPESLKDAAGPKSWRGLGPALEDWGELNTGKRPPGVFVLDVARRQVHAVPVEVPGSDAERDMSFGQPVWTRDGSGLLLVGWPHTSPNFPGVAKKLGVVFCYNRPAYIYHVPVDRNGDGGALTFGAAMPVSKQHHGSATWPTFSPNGRLLVYLSHDTAVETGTHGATAKLCSAQWPDACTAGAPPRVLIDVVDVPPPGLGAASFPGLYANTLPESPFFAGGTALVVPTQWRAQAALLAVHASSGRAAPLIPLCGTGAGAGDCCSFALLAVSGEEVFATRVSPSCPPEVVVAALPSPDDLSRDDWWTSSASGGTALEWRTVEIPGLARSALPGAVRDALAATRYEVVDVAPTCGDTSRTFESVTFLPASGPGPFPAVVAPHGGPHTAVTAGWYMPYLFLAARGYCVVCPNYRGSTGYGQAALASLPGQIGANDVADCVAALDAAVAAGHADGGRAAVVGGSHGGFLTGHLLGQHPDMFKAGVLRNPVCNLSLMVGISDIVDWCYVEVFGSERGRGMTSDVPSPDVLKALFEKSPIAHVHKVKAPMYFMLGAKDRRVPPANAQQYVAALRASVSAPPPMVTVFPEDAHGLDKPQTEFEQWLSCVWWLRKHGVA